MRTQAEMTVARLEEAFRQARARTRALFALARPEAFLARPIPLRHPLIFYEGHLDAFNFNTLLAGALGEPPFRPDFDALFARGIDPADEAAARRAAVSAWPVREAIAAYGAEVQRRLYRALYTADLSGERLPALAGGRLFCLLLEHELMHQETLLYLLHQLPDALKRPEAAGPLGEDGPAAPPRLRFVPAGAARLGAEPDEFPFSWDNERPAQTLSVPAFAIDALPVTNADYMAFVEAGGYGRAAFWRPEDWAWKERAGLRHPFFWRHDGRAWLYRDVFGERPLPPGWPVVVTQAEASAYARYRGRSLPTEAEWQRAAYGDEPGRPYPWGTDAPEPRHGNFGFRRLGPVPVGGHPAGASPFGVEDLLGNGWEWTQSVFAPYPGFRPDPHYPGYSADFFDGRHWVLKGGSWATDARLLRRSFRNWFYGQYPYVYATFRLVDRG